MTTRSGFMKSSMAAPSLRNSGLFATRHVAAGELAEPGGHGGVGAHRHGALQHHDRVGRQVRGQIAHDRPEGRKIDRAVVGRRRAHGQEDDLGLRRGGRQVGGEVQQSGGDVPGNQFRQARLVDRHLAAEQPLDLLPRRNRRR